jgi:hypothetical protein
MVRVLLAVSVFLAFTARSRSDDALDEVNAQRARAGLRPFKRDDGLTAAAKNCAQVRARHRCFGHTGNDFLALPAGVLAGAAGCGCWEPGIGFMSCCRLENWTYAGAWMTKGSDGRWYCHLFVR